MTREVCVQRKLWVRALRKNACRMFGGLPKCKKAERQKGLDTTASLPGGQIQVQPFYHAHVWWVGSDHPAGAWGEIKTGHFPFQRKSDKVCRKAEITRVSLPALGRWEGCGGKPSLKGTHWEKCKMSSLHQIIPLHSHFHCH